MKILIAEDESVSRHALRATLKKWGHEVISTSNGQEALDHLLQPDSAPVAILDWMMPAVDGIGVCRKIREIKDQFLVYIIMLTSRERNEDIVEGLNAGANDFVTKPYHHAELRARVEVGVRMVELQNELTTKVHELEKALEEVKTLRGLFPMCSYCKKIRDDSNFWHQVDMYLREHLDADFSHGICPACYETIIRPQFDALGDE